MDNVIIRNENANGITTYTNLKSESHYEPIGNDIVQLNRRINDLEIRLNDMMIKQEYILTELREKIGWIQQVYNDFDRICNWDSIIMDGITNAKK